MNGDQDPLRLTASGVTKGQRPPAAYSVRPDRVHRRMRLSVLFVSLAVDALYWAGPLTFEPRLQQTTA